MTFCGIGAFFQYAYFLERARSILLKGDEKTGLSTTHPPMFVRGMNLRHAHMKTLNDQGDPRGAETILLLISTEN